MHWGVDAGEVLGGRLGKTSTPIQGLDIDRGLFVFGAVPHPSPCPLTPGLLFGTPMTDVSKLADSTAFKVVMPVLQNVLSAAAIGAFVYVVGALGTLQTTLNSYQTSQALLAARVDSLERSRDTGDKFIDSLRISDQKQDFKIDSITEVLKTIGRPK